LRTDVGNGDKRKEPPGAGCPAQTAPWEDLPLEITQAGRPHAGSARSRAGSRRRLLARIAGTPTKPWGFAAMPSSGFARRTPCLLAFVVLAGISLTHLRQASQRICRINCSRCYSPHSDVRRPAPAPGPAKRRRRAEVRGGSSPRCGQSDFRTAHPIRGRSPGGAPYRRPEGQRSSAGRLR